MKSAVAGVLLVFLATPFHAQESQSPPEDKCMLAGVVVKSTTGAPQFAA